MARQKSLRFRNVSPSAPNHSSLAASEFQLLLIALTEEHQWLLKYIKRKRSELNNFLEQMNTLSSELAHRGTPLNRKLFTLDVEIHSLFKKILTRDFDEETRISIFGVYQALQLTGVISPKFDEDLFGEDDDDLFGEDDDDENSYSEDFEASEDKTENFSDEQNYYQRSEAGEQQQINEEYLAKSRPSKELRRVFLRLAEVFHPDKATDSEQVSRHNEIMKEINRAYSDGDLAKLLEIEQQHGDGEDISIDNSSSSALEKQCKQKEAENQLLRTQYEMLKEELRDLKKTPQGSLVKDYRAGMKQGINPIEIILDSMKAVSLRMEQLKNFVSDFCDEKITIDDFLNGPNYNDSTDFDRMEDLLGRI